jgi:DNA-binding PadR family transcriptional regulator
MQPRLLLQLSKKPAYGYELMGILAEEDDHSAPDPGTLYRTSRQLEEEGLVGG